MRVPPVDAETVTVKHKDIDEMRPWIHSLLVIHAAATTHDFSCNAFTGFVILRALNDGNVHPDLIRVDGPLGEMVPHFHCSYDRLEQIGLSGSQCWNLWAQWPNQWLSHIITFLDSEQINAHDPGFEFPVTINDVRFPFPPSHGGVCGREQVIMDLQFTVDHFGPKIVRTFARHVTFVAVGLRLRRIVKAANTATRDAAEPKGVEVILAPKKILVMIQLFRQMHLVTA